MVKLQKQIDIAIIPVYRKGNEEIHLDINFEI